METIDIIFEKNKDKPNFNIMKDIKFDFQIIQVLLKRIFEENNKKYIKSKINNI